MKRRFFLFAAPALITVSQVMPISVRAASLWKPEPFGVLYDHPRSYDPATMRSVYTRPLFNTGFAPGQEPPELVARWWGDYAAEIMAERHAGTFIPPDVFQKGSLYWNGLNRRILEDIPVFPPVKPRPESLKEMYARDASSPWHKEWQGTTSAKRRKEIKKAFKHAGYSAKFEPPKKDGPAG